MDLTHERANALQPKRFVADPTCGSVSVGTAAGSECLSGRYPFEFSLLSLSTSDIEPGGEVIAMLRLLNVGHDPARVPWITNPDEIELPDDNGTFEYTQADLRADITPDARGADAGNVYVPVHLYGSKEVAGSFQEIRPGEYVELAVKVNLNCKTGAFDCDSLHTGPARVSFTWTESDMRVSYKRCGIESSDIRIRQVESDNAAVRVIPKTASQ